jgi:hypothetical protein
MVAARMNKLVIADVNSNVVNAFVFGFDFRIEENEIAELEIIILNLFAGERLLA